MRWTNYKQLSFILYTVPCVFGSWCWIFVCLQACNFGVRNAEHNADVLPGVPKQKTAVICLTEISFVQTWVIVLLPLGSMYQWYVLNIVSLNTNLQQRMCAGLSTEMSWHNVHRNPILHFPWEQCSTFHKTVFCLLYTIWQLNENKLPHCCTLFQGGTWLYHYWTWLLTGHFWQACLDPEHVGRLPYNARTRLRRTFACNLKAHSDVHFHGT